ncbi:hypothetical protein FVA74_11640 [Salinibacterium sp. dk2585]|uniref:hypothetical protein n=1 Tax=unclassified Salinibacterium TaxID=2632331 RepID=UPI0011C24E42|nr:MULTISPECIES: hypothetical protein [unclassified Salinibacterium]QEE62151.1 hypothetical protein FVA74_11640 [Salinibacterium sp. dk2585]TXK53503.1 hypothetical protein FVP63_09910 [Salinibacterium sp. dk5596]
MRETQDGPIQDGSDDASNEQRLDGIIEQVRSDLRQGHTHESAEQMLRQRVRETGVELSDERIAEIARGLSSAQ